MMIFDVKVGDRINVGNYGSFIKNGYGPLATIISISAGNYLDIRVDGFPYIDEDDDGNFSEDYHTISENDLKLYIKPAEFQYEPSQEGDKEDDI